MERGPEPVPDNGLLRTNMGGARLTALLFEDWLEYTGRDAIARAEDAKAVILAPPGGIALIASLYDLPRVTSGAEYIDPYRGRTYTIEEVPALAALSASACWSWGSMWFALILPCGIVSLLVNIGPEAKAQEV